MSRLAKKPIILPKGVDFNISGRTVSVKGPKGVMVNEVPEGIEVKFEKNQVFFAFEENTSLEKPMLGLFRALVKNSVVGVSVGFEKTLQLIGVGYRANLSGKKLDLQLGFSHPCELVVPQGIELLVDKNVTITVKGVDKKLVGHFAATIRSLKPPEPYKGKGIRYVDEFVRKKAGKAAKGK